MELCRKCGIRKAELGRRICHKCFVAERNEANQRYKTPWLIQGNYPEPRKKTCILCRKKFSTYYPQQIACTHCLNKEGGEYYARWWNKRHPWNPDIFAGFVEAMHRMWRESSGFHVRNKFAKE